MIQTATFCRHTLLNLAGMIGLAIAGIYMVGFDPAALVLAMAAFAITTAGFSYLWTHHYPHSRPGLCNRVTFLRLVLTFALLAPLLAEPEPWRVLIVATMALALDGIDGWLARREGLVSDFGARFDMEVDSALGLVLALNAWAAGVPGLVVLLLGLPRYLFVASAWVWPWMARALPESRARKAACAIQIGSLIVLLVPWVDGGLSLMVLTTAAAILLLSFGRDVLWLYRNRALAMLPT